MYYKTDSHITLFLADVEVKLHGSSASRYALVDSDVNLSISIPDKSVSNYAPHCAW